MLPRELIGSDGSTRYLSPIMALFTIQGLVFIQKLSNYVKKIDFVLISLVAWDLLYTGKKSYVGGRSIISLYSIDDTLDYNHIQSCAGKAEIVCSKEGTFLTTTGLSALDANITKKWITYALVFIFLVTGLHFLQNYRDTTRYIYYGGHTDLEDHSKKFVNAWEFLDHPDGSKTIAMTMGWEPPGDHWFFYPLLGRWLQNDIVYISAKYGGEILPGFTGAC